MSQLAPPPVSSPDTQRILDLCQAVAGGKMELYPELEAAARHKQSQMTSVSDQFFAEIEKQPQEFQDKLAQEVELIERLYEGFGQALDAILNFKADPKPESLGEAAMLLSFSSNGLVGAMTTYEQRVLSDGPHKLPLINLFANLSAALREGRVGQEAWELTCVQYKDFYKEAIVEIDNSKHKNDKGVPERRVAFEKLVACLGRLEAMTRSTSAAQFEGEISTLAEGHDELNIAIATFNDAAVEKPTPSRAVNTVLMAARNVVAGTMQRDVLRNLCIQQLEEIQKAISEAQMAARTPTDSATVQEEGARILESMEGIEESLETLLAFSEAEDGKAEIAKDAMQRLEDFTMQLSAANNNIQEYNERYGKIVCPACSTYNVPSNRVCSNCNRQLPQMTGSQEYGVGPTSSLEISEGPAGAGDTGPVVTDVMKRLFDACEGFERRKVSAEELLAMLDGLDRAIADARAKIPRYKLPPIPEDAPEDQRQDAEEVAEVVLGGVALMEQGIEDCEFGIAKIRQGVQDDSSEAILEGQQFYFQGCQYMWQVRRLEEQFQNYIDTHMREDGVEDSGPADTGLA